MMVSEKRYCLECATEIHGRADKKFCDDGCRNNYNNQLNSDVNKEMRRINNALRKNRRILLTLNPNGKTTVTRSQLLLEGFNFDYHTSIYTTKSGNVYFFCYEYGYLDVGNDLFMLVIKQKYTEGNAFPKITGNDMES